MQTPETAMILISTFRFRSGGNAKVAQPLTWAFSATRSGPRVNSSYSLRVFRISKSHRMASAWASATMVCASADDSSLIIQEWPYPRIHR